MIREVIDIEQYPWRVYAYMGATAKDTPEILDKLESIGINAAQFMRAERHIHRAARDSGMTYSSPYTRASVMVIGHSSSEQETVNTFSHELRHLTDDIAEFYSINPRGEEVAYLTGDIALALAGSLLHVVCDCPICSKK